MAMVMVLVVNVLTMLQKFADFKQLLTAADQFREETTVKESYF